MRVLVVDDEEVIRAFLAQILTGAGCEVVTGPGRREAVDLPAHWIVDCVRLMSGPNCHRDDVIRLPR